MTNMYIKTIGLAILLLLCLVSNADETSCHPVEISVKPAITVFGMNHSPFKISMTRDGHFRHKNISPTFEKLIIDCRDKSHITIQATCDSCKPETWTYSKQDFSEQNKLPIAVSITCESEAVICSETAEFYANHDDIATIDSHFVLSLFAKLIETPESLSAYISAGKANKTLRKINIGNSLKGTQSWVDSKFHYGISVNKKHKAIAIHGNVDDLDVIYEWINHHFDLLPNTNEKKPGHSHKAFTSKVHKNQFHVKINTHPNKKHNDLSPIMEWYFGSIPNENLFFMPLLEVTHEHESSANLEIECHKSSSPIEKNTIVGKRNPVYTKQTFKIVDNKASHGLCLYFEKSDKS